MTAAVRSVLIAGGGFAGMAAAIECAKRDIAVTLLETDTEWRSYGAGISLGGATLRAFATLGILDGFLRVGAASDGVDLCTPAGDVVGQLPTPRLAGPDVPGGGGVMRPVLARLMADAVRAAGVEVRLGCRIASMAPAADGVDVTDSAGRSGHYDVVVGADGLNSTLRIEVFPDAPTPQYTGQGVWRAVLPRPAGLERVRMWMGGAVKPGVNPVSATHLYLFLTENRPDNERIPQAEQPALLRALLAPFPDPMLQRLAAQIDADAQVVYRPLETLLLPAPWYVGRVVLIGDAVHATTPHLASGACIGIEDGIVLADELGRGADADAALQAFQTRRHERCRMVVENSKRLGAIEVQGGDKQEHAALMRASMMALAAPI